MVKICNMISSVCIQLTIWVGGSVLVSVHMKALEWPIEGKKSFYYTSREDRKS